jgi:hypothetical protein
MSERIDAIYYDDAHRLPRSGWVGVEVDLIEVSTFQIRFKWFRSKYIITLIYTNLFVNLAGTQNAYQHDCICLRLLLPPASPLCFSLAVKMVCTGLLHTNGQCFINKISVSYN